MGKENRYDSYVKSPYGNAWGLPHQDYNLLANPAKNDWIRSGYAYYPKDETLNLWDDQGSTLVPRYTARKFDKLSRIFPYVTDNIWTRKDLSHKTGYTETATGKTVTGAGINALFKDGHVLYVADHPVKIQGQQGRFFDNIYWTTWERENPPDARYIHYNLYKLIQP
jgi:hypothetical protein